MKYKLLIIAVALGVTGAAVGGGLYLAYPVQVTTLAAMARNYLHFLVRASRHDNHGIERGLQRRRGCCVLACRRGVTSPDTTAGDWPSYNKTLTSERYSQLEPDQYEECRQAKGFVHLRRR